MKTFFLHIFLGMHEKRARVTSIIRKINKKYFSFSFFVLLFRIVECNCSTNIISETFSYSSSVFVFIHVLFYINQNWFFCCTDPQQKPNRSSPAFNHKYADLFKAQNQIQTILISFSDERFHTLYFHSMLLGFAATNEIPIRTQ